ncbi:hypothetical protein CC79DRAFT_1366859 [Sarocladium strictum]
MPSVELSISTQPSTLNFEGDEPMTISVSLTLKHTMPITFRESDSSLFNGDLLHENGLTFTNLSTGELAKRGTINVCTFGLDANLTYETLGSYKTLYPGREEVVEGTIGPMDSDFVAKFMPDHEGRWWPMAQGLESGSRYEVGISASVLARRCAEGTKEQLLQILRPDKTLEDVAMSGAVPLVLINMAKFECVSHD